MGGVVVGYYLGLVVAVLVLFMFLFLPLTNTHNPNPTPSTGANNNGLAAPLLAAPQDESDEAKSEPAAPHPHPPPTHPPLPEPDAGLFSLWSFSWLNPVLAEGYRRPLTHDDLYALHPDETADVICAKYDGGMCI